MARFAPLALLATGWIALLVGLTLGVDGGRRIGAGDVAIGVLVGLLPLAGVGGAVLLVLERIPSAGALFPDLEHRMTIAVCIAASLADTSRHAARRAASGWARGAR